MTQTLVTIDTELSALWHQRGANAEENFASSILGRCRDGEFGIGWQMRQFDAFGVKAVFFVDPMPALVYGNGWLLRLVDMILTGGHEVQLHLHTEWLAWAKSSPVGGRTGQNLADFSLDDQRTLLEVARDQLIAAGAPAPIAFRAGNYGANDDSLRALASLGLVWDSSFNPAYLGQGCAIGLDGSQVSAVERLGVIELPVAGLYDRPGNVRPAQICALSTREMRAALIHAARNAHPAFAIVTHSFEMLSRDRQRPNRAVMKRLESLCQMIGEHEHLSSAGFADLEPKTVVTKEAARGQRLAPDRLRTITRMAEQAVATWRYERRLRPA